jgi:DNA-binding NtrC family response regulator
MTTDNFENRVVTILYVEDAPDSRDEFIEIIRIRYPDMRLFVAEDGKKGLESFILNKPEIVITDLNMPVKNGIAMASEIKAMSPATEIVVLTAYSDSNYLLQAIELGVSNFVLKPINVEQVISILDKKIDSIWSKQLIAQQNELIVQLNGELEQKAEQLESANQRLEKRVAERTLDLSRSNELLTHEIAERKKTEDSLQTAYLEIQQLKDRLQAENMYLQREIAQEHNFGEIVGQCKALKDLFVRIKQVAPMNATVLLLGETGSGKGVVARAIHSNSSRKDRPMITVNCTALPANLIESELFGRERGAFTGAHDRQIGRFELAHNGTIFLDEIGEMPIELQSKLLRVIQDGEFERLGSPRTIKVDVRIIAATNRNLEDEIRKGTFREDLFYRLNVFPLHIPPLRERTEDIPELVQSFIHKFNKKMNKKIESVAKSSLNNLMDYHWPGNVRELESIIERAVITSQGTQLQVLDSFVIAEKNGISDRNRVKMLDELERDHILKVLQTTYWRIEGKTGAAVLLGINPSTLRARMRKFGINRAHENE